MASFTYSAIATATSWQPSPDRTIVVPAMSSTSLRGITTATSNTLQVYQMPPKASVEDLDFSFDIAANLAPGDAISSVSCGGSQPSGLSVLFAGGRGTVATLWLDGGTAGQTYLLAVTIQTTQGRTRYVQATITIPSLAA